MLSVEEQARIWSRFFSKIDRSGACWLWTGTKTDKGYGTYGRVIGGVRGAYAHRIIWELLHGEIPEGLCVCHSCDTPLCVNIGHLFLGTHQENMTDMAAKNRASRRKPKKLSDQDVIEILELRASGVGVREIVRLYSSNTGTVWRLEKHNIFRSC